MDNTSAEVEEGCDCTTSSTCVPCLFSDKVVIEASLEPNISQLSEGHFSSADTFTSSRLINGIDDYNVSNSDFLSSSNNSSNFQEHPLSSPPQRDHGKAPKRKQKSVDESINSGSDSSESWLSHIGKIKKASDSSCSSPVPITKNIQKSRLLSESPSNQHPEWPDYNAAYSELTSSSSSPAFSSDNRYNNFFNHHSHKNHSSQYAPIIHLQEMFPYLLEGDIISMYNQNEMDLNKTTEFIFCNKPPPTDLASEIASIFPEYPKKKIRDMVSAGKTHEEIINVILNEEDSPQEFDDLGSSNTVVTGPANRIIFVRPKKKKNVPAENVEFDAKFGMLLEIFEGYTDEFLKSNLRDNGEDVEETIASIFRKQNSARSSPRMSSSSSSPNLSFSQQVCESFLPDEKSDDSKFSVVKRKQVKSASASLRLDSTRRAATAYHEERVEYFNKAAKHFKRGGLYAGAAAYYSQEGHKKSEEMHKAHERAAKQIISNNEATCAPGVIDLHGLSVKEAVAYSIEQVNAWHGNRETPNIRIIAGLGKHSKGLSFRIYPAVLSMLKSNNWDVVELGQGNMMVKGLKR